MTRPVHTFDEFINAAVESLGQRDVKRPFFVSGETLTDALRRWWGEVVQLDVNGDHQFSWICSGCTNRVVAEGQPLYALPMFDYVLWEHCPRCFLALSDGG